MQILRPYLRPTELETLEVGPAICVLFSLPGILRSAQVLDIQTSEMGLK